MCQILIGFVDFIVPLTITLVWSSLIKPLQNKKGQKNLGYPRKKQSFYKEQDLNVSPVLA